MAKVELIMPKMGESIMEATILKWLKAPGDSIEIEESVLEIATDKVDSEVPAPVEGTMGEILFQEGDVVAVGEAIAYIITEGAETSGSDNASDATKAKAESTSEAIAPNTQVANTAPTTKNKTATATPEDRFYSPLVLNIAKQEGISMADLQQLPGSGKNGRVTKKDILAYVKEGKPSLTQQTQQTKNTTPTTSKSTTPPAKVTTQYQNAEVIEMNRKRQMIAKHMVDSVHTSAHVTSFAEVDVTHIVDWRNKHKKILFERSGEKLTFTPIFMEAAVKAIADFPWINSSIDGTNIIVHKSVNLGMAAALANGNLIVPVIKQAEQLNLLGMTKAVNDLANRARQNKLQPDEIQGGTFTVTNVGSFGSVMGTPIINQPQVAILAVGAIRKKPAVVKTEFGDAIAIRHLMMMSLSYDHRIIDGAMGSKYLNHVVNTIEQFDVNQSI